MLLLGLPLIRPLLFRLLETSGHDELLVLFGLLLAFVGGAAFEQVGMSSELGALVLGGLLSGHAKSVELFKIGGPLIAQFVGDQPAKLGIARIEPATRGDSVGLVDDPVGITLVEI